MADVAAAEPEQAVGRHGQRDRWDLVVVDERGRDAMGSRLRGPRPMRAVHPVQEDDEWEGSRSRGPVGRRPHGDVAPPPEGAAAGGDMAEAFDLEAGNRDLDGRQRVDDPDSGSPCPPSPPMTSTPVAWRPTS